MDRIYSIKTAGKQTFCEIWSLMCSSARSCGILLLLSDHDIGVRVVGCDDAVRITHLDALERAVSERFNFLQNIPPES